MNRILESDRVTEFASRYPRIYQYIFRRFSIRKFSGLPLTFLSIAIVANLFLLFNLTEEVINAKEFILIDRRISEFLFSYRIERIARMFYYFSKAGGVIVISTSAAILLIIFLVLKKFHHVLAILLSVFGSGISVLFGKNIFKVQRPLGIEYYAENSFSFPSGHATIAVAYYGLLIYILIRATGSFRHQFYLAVSGLVFIAAIGFSRLYLGVHFFSDVMAGYQLGFLWLLSSISLDEWMKMKISGKEK